VSNRTNPQNGFCLNAIHVRAFDCGLLTVTLDLKVKLSSEITKAVSEEATSDLLLKYEGAQVRLPRRFAPDPGFLRYHNDSVFEQPRIRR
jgi:putative restriction endonuclease